MATNELLIEKSYSHTTTVKSGWKEAYGLKSQQTNDNTDSFFLVDIFVLNTPFSSPRLSLTTPSEGGNTGLYSLPPPTCLLTLNSTLCVSLLLPECVWGLPHRQDWLLSSTALHSISLKGELIAYPERSRKPCPEPESSNENSLAPDFVLLSTDLPCCQCATAGGRRRTALVILSLRSHCHPVMSGKWNLFSFKTADSSIKYTQHTL